MTGPNATELHTPAAGGAGENTSQLENGLNPSMLNTPADADAGSGEKPKGFINKVKEAQYRFEGAGKTAVGKMKKDSTLQEEGHDQAKSGSDSSKTER